MDDLNLPTTTPLPDRVSFRETLPAGKRATYAALDGSGCIRHIWVSMAREEMHNLDVVIRIFFDDEPVPYVEAPLGDFFGVMHGKVWYPVNTRYLSVKGMGGLNCYFPMPFAKSARIEFESGEHDHRIYIQVDWHRYPAEMQERRRFCARWRREMPTQRYGEDFLMLDADGPGRLVGFVYGVRLLDDVDRWSHGGSENIYIDGDGEHPVYLRGIGGEDTFGAGFGGALHPPDTHLHAGMPYYVHEDVLESRPAQRLVGYRFFDEDAIEFTRSIHMRFGTMRNDISSTVYWYQQGAVRPFFEMPPWPAMKPGTELSRGSHDLPLPSDGRWWLCGPFGAQDGKSMEAALPPELEFSPDATYDGMHEEDSPWLSDGSKELGRNAARWVERPSIHGFIDFNHVFRPYAWGMHRTHDGVAVARCVLHSPDATTARVRLAWDDRMLLRVNDEEPIDLGRNYAFRSRTVDVPLRAGANIVVLKLSNGSNADQGPRDSLTNPTSNHGGWAFSFQATTQDGATLVPQPS